MTIYDHIWPFTAASHPLLCNSFDHIWPYMTIYGCQSPPTMSLLWSNSLLVWIWRACPEHWPFTYHYTCTHLHTHTHTCTHLHKYPQRTPCDKNTTSYTRAHYATLLLDWAHTHTLTHAHRHRHTHAHTYIHTCIHTHLHTHSQAHTHAVWRALYISTHHQHTSSSAH